MTVQGGMSGSDLYVDDPLPVVNRGVWLNGLLHHFSITEFVLNHNLTIGFLIKSYMTTPNLGTLYAS